MKLSYRDKIILAVFVLIMTLFVGFFVAIKPKLKSISDNNQLLAERRDYKAEVINSIDSLDKLRQNYEDENKQIKELNSFFIPHMNTSEVDKYIYKIAEENDISIDDMQLVSSEEKELALYNPLSLDDNDTVKVNVDCTTTNIIFRVDSQENIKSFLDDIDNLDTSVIVDSCVIDFDTEKNIYNVQIGVLFYSV